MKAWQVCEDCGDDWCNLHGMHVKDCPCPMHCEWQEDPLATVLPERPGTGPTKAKVVISP